MSYPTEVYGALGTTFSWSSTVVVQVQEIDDWDMEFGTRDTTNLASTVKSVASTILDPGELSLTIQWAPGDTTHKDLTTSFLAGTSATALITYTDTSTLSGTAYITKFAPKVGGVEDNLTASITLKFTGALTFTPATT